jgi:hypothetical protein
MYFEIIGILNLFRVLHCKFVLFDVIKAEYWSYQLEIFPFSIYDRFTLKGIENQLPYLLCIRDMFGFK